MEASGDQLYALAISCAKQNANGCDYQCQSCQLNVFKYTSDVTQASLLKATAFSDFQMRQRLKAAARTQDIYHRAAKAAPLIVLLLAIAVVAQTCAPKPKQAARAPATATEVVVQTSILQSFMNAAEAQRQQLSVPAETAWLKAHQNQYENIPRVLRLLRRDAMWDYDGDGQVDCSDYSKVFALVYGSDAVLVANTNPTNGMNHMFVRVFYDGQKFMDVEPQRSYDDYAMRTAWGSAYDPKYNRYW